jgi:hypothetical protein
VEQAAIEPSVDELIDLIDKDIGRESVMCPICGHTEWHILEDSPVGVAMVAARAPASESGWTGFFAVGFYCDRCGFVRLHTVGPDQATGEA